MDLLSFLVVVLGWNFRVGILWVGFPSWTFLALLCLGGQFRRWFRLSGWRIGTKRISTSCKHWPSEVKCLDLLKTDYWLMQKHLPRMFSLIKNESEGDRNGGDCRCLVAELRLKYSSTTKKILTSRLLAVIKWPRTYLLDSFGIIVWVSR